VVTHGSLLVWCPPDLWTGHVRWMASLFLSRLGDGWSIGEAVAGMMTGISVDTECTVVWDCSFPVWLRNTAMVSFGSRAWRVWVAALLMWLVC